MKLFYEFVFDIVSYSNNRCGDSCTDELCDFTWERKLSNARISCCDVFGSTVSKHLASEPVFAPQITVSD